MKHLLNYMLKFDVLKRRKQLHNLGFHADAGQSYLEEMFPFIKGKRTNSHFT